MTSIRIVALLLLSCHAASSKVAVEEASATAVNPIRKVVTMLQNMQKKIAAEGAKKEEMFDKYMCYCKNADPTTKPTVKPTTAPTVAVTPATTLPPTPVATPAKTDSPTQSPTTMPITIMPTTIPTAMPTAIP